MKTTKNLNQQMTTLFGSVLFLLSSTFILIALIKVASFLF